MSVFEEHWKMKPLRCGRKWPHLCACSANALNVFQLPPGEAGTGLEGETAGSDLPAAARSLQTGQGPAVSAGVAKSLQATLLSDAQLISDGLSSLVLNGARVKTKAGGGGGVLLCTSQVYGEVILLLGLSHLIWRMKSPVKYLAVISFTF